MKRQPARVRLSAILWPALGFAILAALLVLHAGARISVTELGFTLSKLQAREQELSREHSRLELQVLTLRAPAQLERIARRRLGMAPPGPQAILHEPFRHRGHGPAQAAVLAERP
ncbi:MAG: hypothetical protein ACYCWW_03590 [Deltaproteobacteria bacterium]